MSVCVVCFQGALTSPSSTSGTATLRSGPQTTPGPPRTLRFREASLDRKRGSRAPKSGEEEREPSGRGPWERHCCPREKTDQTACVYSRRHGGATEAELSVTSSDRSITRRAAGTSPLRVGSIESRAIAGARDAAPNVSTSPRRAGSPSRRPGAGAGCGEGS